MSAIEGARLVFSAERRTVLVSIPAPVDNWAPRRSASAEICNAERVAVLCGMSQQLREAAKDEHWTLDWNRFNAYGEQAQAALAGGDYRRAVREYALAISFMMSEIRRQPTHKDARDSSVLDL